MIRYDGRTYVEIGFVAEGTTIVGDAEVAACDDNATTEHDAVGSYFPERPRIEQAWAIDGFDESRVVAIADRGATESFRVFAPTSLTQDELEQLRRQVDRQGHR
jgi:hypothetical protein